MEELSSVIKDSLESFYNDVSKNSWKGREREAVSHFVTAHINKFINKNGPLYDLAQIVIEGAVKQDPSKGKKHVNKDLLVWPNPGMTAWNDKWIAEYVPLAVLEWKVHRPRNPFKEFHPHDIAWLNWFTSEHTESFGCAVALDISGLEAALHVAYFENGKANYGWIQR